MLGMPLQIEEQLPVREAGRHAMGRVHRQRGLPHAGHPVNGVDEDHRAVGGRREGFDLVGPADEADDVAGQVVRPGRRRLAERQVVAENPVVQLGQYGPGLDTELLDHAAVRVAVQRQRVHLAVGSVQRHHERGHQALTKRSVVEEVGQFREDLAMATGGQFRLVEQLVRSPAHLVQTGPDATSQPVIGRVRQQRPTPQAQGRPEYGDPRMRVVDRAGRGDQIPEPVGVHCVRIGEGGEAIAGGLDLDSEPPVPVGIQPGSQAGDMGLDRPKWMAGSGGLPQQIDQTVDRHGAAHLQQEQPEQ